MRGRTTQNFFWMTMIQLMVFVYSLVSVCSKYASVALLEEGPFSRQLFFFVSLMLLLMALYAFVWQKILKAVDLSVAYFNKGLTLLWTMLWSVLFFGETISLNNVAGILVILLGLFLVNSNE